MEREREKYIFRRGYRYALWDQDTTWLAACEPCTGDMTKRDLSTGVSSMVLRVCCPAWCVSQWGLPSCSQLLWWHFLGRADQDWMWLDDCSVVLHRMVPMGCLGLSVSGKPWFPWQILLGLLCPFLYQILLRVRSLGPLHWLCANAPCGFRIWIIYVPVFGFLHCMGNWWALVYYVLGSICWNIRVLFTPVLRLLACVSWACETHAIMLGKVVCSLQWCIILLAVSLAGWHSQILMDSTCIKQRMEISHDQSYFGVGREKKREAGKALQQPCPVLLKLL